MKSLYLGLFSLTIGLAAPCALAKKPDTTQPTLKEVLESAKKDGKLAFILFGREACGNCQALRGYIAQGSVQLSKNRFVYADLNCDDPATSQAIYKAFKVEGSALPFVVIAGNDGKQLVSRTGFGSPEDFNKLVKEADKALPKPDKTAAKAGKNTLKKPAAAAAIVRDESREMRTWTSVTSGAKIKASLVEEYGGAVILMKEDGAKVSIVPAYLTKEDQDYIEKLRAPPPEKPAETAAVP